MISILAANHARDNIYHKFNKIGLYIRVILPVHKVSTLRCQFRLIYDK